MLSEVARRGDVQAAMDGGRTLAELVNRARDWVNTPPNSLTPEVFAEAVRTLDKDRGGRRSGVRVEVLGVPELTELGCGGILGVGQGSANDPCLVRLTWAPADAVASIALVGKGVTYDSGD